MDKPTTRVVNISDGARCDVYIGRSKKPSEGYFGNPYKIGKDGDRDVVLKKYKHYFEERLSFDKEFKSRVEALRGKILGCFCADGRSLTADDKPFVCHGQIIAEYLDGRRS